MEETVASQAEATREAALDQSVQQVVVMVLPSGKIDRLNCSKATGRSTKTLSEWARLGIGPKPHNIAGRVFYDWAEVQAFMGAS